MDQKEFTPIAAGWVAYNGRYLAYLANGDLHFSHPLPSGRDECEIIHEKLKLCCASQGREIYGPISE